MTFDPPEHVSGGQRPRYHRPLYPMDGAAAKKRNISIFRDGPKVVLLTRLFRVKSKREMDGLEKRYQNLKKKQCERHDREDRQTEEEMEE